MRNRIKPDRFLTARVLVWAGLSVLLLWYVRWGSETVSLTSYFHIRRSTPFIWNTFHEGLPQIGNETMLDIVYWTAIATSVVGVLALLWLALTPSAAETAEPAEMETELPPA